MPLKAENLQKKKKKKNIEAHQNFPLREKFPYSELFWSIFSRILTKCGEILGISPYSLRMRENTRITRLEYHRIRTLFTQC